MPRLLVPDRSYYADLGGTGRLLTELQENLVGQARASHGGGRTHCFPPVLLQVTPRRR